MSTSLPTVYVATRIKNFAEEVKRRIPELNVRETDYSKTGILSEADFKSLNANVEIVVADGHIFAEIISTSKTLKWTEVPSSGFRYTVKAIKQSKHPDFVLTTSGGKYNGRSIAEYLIGQIIAWERRFFEMHEEQKSKAWNQLKWVPCRTLDVITIVILGNGILCSEVGAFCKDLGLKVLTFSGSLEEEKAIDSNRYAKELVDILESCDFVCNLLPSTSETQSLLPGDVMKQCKKKPVFINIGDDDVTDTDTDSILTAIRNKWISGAILDIFPKGQSLKYSELSSLPNVVITHGASGASNYKENIDNFVDNIYKYANGQQLNNIVPMDISEV